MKFFKSCVSRPILFIALVNGLSILVPDPFQAREATIDRVHDALFVQGNNCREVVSSFLARIEAYDSTVNAIISLNKNVLDIADAMDMQLAMGNATGSLFCIPILLKDNFNTAEMNTTGGCLALAGSQPTVDAPVTAALKNAGAIILGKVNMHELALEGISVSSLGGQTVNPYDHTRTPGGSSGGTGAAIASSFAIFGTGTDTVNSLRSPASANSLFSIRPTRGLISRAGIIPISYTQDAVGPIARTVNDLAKALTVMASIGHDPEDNATSLVPISSQGVDYSASIHREGLSGVRLGMIDGFFNRTASDETTPVNQAMYDMVAVLEKAGATVIAIKSSVYNATTIQASLDVQTSEYREGMDKYLSDPALSGTHPSGLLDLYSSSKFLVLPSQYGYVNAALVSSTGNSSYHIKKQGIQNLTATLHHTIITNNLSALIYPEQKNLVMKIGSTSQSGRNGILAALTGSPVVTVPAGFSPPTGDAPIGVPVGMEILGMPWSEALLLEIAANIERLRPVRKMPVFANASVEFGVYEAVPSWVPNRGNIPDVYPIGILE